MTAQREDELSKISKITWSGEDRFAGDRQMLQKMQMKKWLDQQISEKKHRQNMAARDERKHSQHSQALNNYRGDMESQMKQERLDRNRRIMEENRQIAAATTERRNASTNRKKHLSKRALEKSQEEAKVNQQYTAMTPSRRNQIFEEQEQQRIERAKRASEKKLATLNDFKRSQQMMRMAAEFDHEQELDRARKDKEHQAELLMAMKCKNKTRDREERQKPGFGGAFFSKFGRSDR